MKHDRIGTATTFPDITHLAGFDGLCHFAVYWVNPGRDRNAKLIATTSILLSLAACAPIVRSHGNFGVTDDQLSQIHPGVSQQFDVAAILGTPSAEGTFDPNQWYYIGQVTEKTAFFAPEVVGRKVLRITFDQATGNVAKIEQLDKDAGQNVDLVARTTPTSGHDLGMMEQVLGNIGRFTKELITSS